MNTVKLIAFITSFACLWSVFFCLLLFIIFKRWSNKANRDAKSKMIDHPYIQMNDPKVLDDLLEFRRKPIHFN